MRKPRSPRCGFVEREQLHGKSGGDARPRTLDLFGTGNGRATRTGRACLFRVNAEIWLGGAMVAGIVMAIGVHARPEEKRAQITPPAPLGPPWISREAGSELIGPDGGPGRLFAGVDLGGLPPSADVRARIDAFARTHDVDIDIDIDDDIVTAIRAEVIFRGAFGYEGADVFALRMRRPWTGGCGTPHVWIDDWAHALEDGIYLRARVVENRVVARWQPILTTDAMLDEAEALLGRERADVARAAGDRWREVEPSSMYVLELPYGGHGDWIGRSNHHGIVATTHAGRIRELSFAVRTDRGDPVSRTVSEILEARWGKPRMRDGVATWTRRDRVITAELDEWNPLVTMRMR